MLDDSKRTGFPGSPDPFDIQLRTTASQRTGLPGNDPVRLTSYGVYCSSFVSSEIERSGREHTSVPDLVCDKSVLSP